MSGINSISGLNNVNVDFRPTIEPDVPKTANASQPQPVEIINLDDVQQPPVRNEAKNVVRDLDVLLLNAAGRSVAMDAARNVNTIGRDLVNTGVISEKDLANLESLAKDAAAKLKALDKFSGREIAKALMVDKKSAYGDLVWGKGLSRRRRNFRRRSPSSTTASPGARTSPLRCRTRSRNCSSSATGARRRSTR